MPRLDPRGNTPLTLRSPRNPHQNAWTQGSFESGWRGETKCNTHLSLNDQYRAQWGEQISEEMISQNHQYPHMTDFSHTFQIVISTHFHVLGIVVWVIWSSFNREKCNTIECDILHTNVLWKKMTTTCLKFFHDNNHYYPLMCNHYKKVRSEVLLTHELGLEAFLDKKFFNMFSWQQS